MTWGSGLLKSQPAVFLFHSLCERFFSAIASSNCCRPLECETIEVVEEAVAPRLKRCLIRRILRTGSMSGLDTDLNFIAGMETKLFHGFPGHAERTVCS